MLCQQSRANADTFVHRGNQVPTTPESIGASSRDRDHVAQNRPGTPLATHAKAEKKKYDRLWPTIPSTQGPPQGHTRVVHGETKCP
jgi:hypothetical protein